MKRKMSLFLVGLICLSMIMIFSMDEKVKTTASGSLFGFTSVFADYSPKIDGVVAEDEWDSASNIELDQGSLLIQNDATNLYLLVDLTGDTNNDPPLLAYPWGDFFWLSFDVDRDGIITPWEDVNYGLYPATHDLGIAYYLGPNSWTGASYDTRSQLGAGFGPSINSGVPHRIWELAISLSEINSYPTGLVRIGLRTYSQEPSFEHDLPVNFYADFSNLIEIALANTEVEFLVLADEDFCDALKPLKVHKDYTGITTYVQSWQSLNKSVDGWDVAERVKRGIATYEQYCNTLWVMLVGDCDKFPVRYIRAYNTEWGSKYYPSDLYYADLYDDGKSFDDWDYNNNQIFGEMDFSGGSDLNEVNLDRIHMYPDVMVGRIPASNVNEVTTYVNKVISYEFAAYQSSWFKKALWTVDEGIPDSWGSRESKNNLDGYLPSFTIIKSYYDPEWTFAKNATGLNKRADIINGFINNGVGFVNYYGHGNRKTWSWVYSQDPPYYHLDDLTNEGKLPVIYASACYTGRFHFDIDYYLDVNHQEWNTSRTGARTEPMAVQPAKYDREALAEDFLVKRQTGAISYIGSTSKSEHSIMSLDTYFFEAYHVGWKPPTLGYMWNYALQQFITLNASHGMDDYYAYIQMHKTFFFGDPSLRVGGVSRTQKQDFLGTYNMNHDGWKGTLELWAGPDDPIEQLPNIQGTYIGEDGKNHTVYGYVRTWQYPKPVEWGPDHKIEFYIDFPDTLQKSDDQKFEGYLFTQTKKEIAGITWWSSTPFGFYATEGTVASLEIEDTEIDKSNFVGTYNMNHDGWKGTIDLWGVADNYIEQIPNIKGLYKAASGAEHSVRGYVRTPTYPFSPEWGPDHKILFYIDFDDTLDESDDQKFEGYLFTQTKDNIAGKTWWQGTAFGFYMERIPLSIFPVILEETYWIHILSHSDVVDFNFSEIQKQISFTVICSSGTTGCCNVTIPLALLSGDFTVYMDSSPMTENVNYRTINATHGVFDINYPSGTHLIEIEATIVIPELSTLIMLSLFMLISLIAILTKRYRRE